MRGFPTAKKVFVKVLPVRREVVGKYGINLGNTGSFLGREVLLLIRRSYVRIFPGAPAIL